jgi:hypothetical protein
MKASPETLALIHELLAQDMLGRLKDGESVVTKDAEGNTVVTKVGCSAATLGQIRQFLKDNNTEADPVRNKPLVNLAAALPFPGDDAEPQGATH